MSIRRRNTTVIGQSLAFCPDEAQNDASLHITGPLESKLQLHTAVHALNTMDCGAHTQIARCVDYSGDHKEIFSTDDAQGLAFDGDAAVDFNECTVSNLKPGSMSFATGASVDFANATVSNISLPIAALNPDNITSNNGHTTLENELDAITTSANTALARTQAPHLSANRLVASNGSGLITSSGIAPADVLTTSSSIAASQLPSTVVRTDVDNQVITKNFKIQAATGDAILTLEADPNNSSSQEGDNSFLTLTQDGGGTKVVMGLNGDNDCFIGSSSGFFNSGVVLQTNTDVKPIKFNVGLTERARVTSTGFNLPSNHSYQINSQQIGFDNLRSGSEATLAQLPALPISQTTNLQSTLDGKQATITNGDLTIAHTSGLQAALDTKQSTIGDGDLTIARTTGLQQALDAKQNTIGDGDLTIARTSGLQAALDAKQSAIGDGDLTIARTTGLQTALDTKQSTIADGDLTIARTTGLQTALNAKQATITNGDLTIAHTSGLQAALDGKQSTIADGDLTVARTAGLQALLDNKQSTIGDGDLTIARTAGLQAALDVKQDTIADGDLTIARTSGLQTALNGKQATITNGDLTIAHTSGLQAALDTKQSTIGDGDLTIARTNGLQAALDTKQSTIGDGDLTIARTDGLQSALDGKQSTITNGDLTIAHTSNLQAALDDKANASTTINKTSVSQTIETTGLTGPSLALRHKSNFQGNPSLIIENQSSTGTTLNKTEMTLENDDVAFVNTAVNGGLIVKNNTSNEIFRVDQSGAEVQELRVQNDAGVTLEHSQASVITNGIKSLSDAGDVLTIQSSKFDLDSSGNLKCKDASAKLTVNRIESLSLTTEPLTIASEKFSVSNTGDVTAYGDVTADGGALTLGTPSTNKVVLVADAHEGDAHSLLIRPNGADTIMAVRPDGVVITDDATVGLAVDCTASQGNAFLRCSAQYASAPVFNTATVEASIRPSSMANGDEPDEAMTGLNDPGGYIRMHQERNWRSRIETDGHFQIQAQGPTTGSVQTYLQCTNQAGIQAFKQLEARGGFILGPNSQTAPSSSSGTGTKGEVKFDSNYLYIATATNTWKRVALSSY